MSLSTAQSFIILLSFSIYTTMEQTFFKGQDIHITNSRAVFGSRTYSMANVTSVAMMVKTPNRLPGIILIALGLFTFAAKTVLIGVILIPIGIMLMIRKPEYFVRISSSSGEANARSSK